MALGKSRKGDFRRFNQGASPVHKLGHYGYVVPKAKCEETLRGYTTNINLKPTDTIPLAILSTRIQLKRESQLLPTASSSGERMFPLAS